MAKGLGHWYVEIQKQGYWRGQAKTWVNRYVMSGSDPSAPTANTVINALKAVEDEIYPPIAAAQGVGFVAGRAYGAAGGTFISEQLYNATLAPADATGFTGPSGGYSTLSFEGTLENTLDVRTLLTGLSSTGKPVYLLKYFRGIIATGEAGNVAPIASADITKINGTALQWKTGVGGTSYVVIGVSGRLASEVPTAQPFIGNHQVPRGRKRTSAAGAAALVGAVAYAAGSAGDPPPDAAVPKRPGALEPDVGAGDIPFVP